MAEQLSNYNRPVFYSLPFGLANTGQKWPVLAIKFIDAGIFLGFDNTIVGSL
jgi:hypothetical protein